MNYIASGSAFPILTFYCSPNFYSINETSIISFSPQYGSKVCYQSKGAIKNAVNLSSGNILLLEDTSESVLFNPKTKSVRKGLISSQCVADSIAISSAGEFIVMVLASGNVLVYKQQGDEIKFIKNIYMPEDQYTVSFISIETCLMDDKLVVHRFVSYDLENTTLLVDTLNQDLSVSHDSHLLPGIKFAQLTKVIQSEDRTISLAVDSDCITYCTFLFSPRRFKSCVFKIRNRPSNKPFSFIMTGPSYNLNDFACPAFFLFGPGNEVVLGIVYADAIKFWNVSSELEDIQSGVQSEESGLFFCSSLSKSAFLEIDVKGLKLSIVQFADAFFPFSDTVNQADGNALYCLSSQKDFIYKLGEGIYMKNRLSTDSLFKGVNNVWTLKKHYLDYCHVYLLCSTAFGSVLLSIEDSSASDVTGLLGIDKNEASLCAFNVPGSSFVVHVSPSAITAYDFSKIDSANSDIIKTQINSSSSNTWQHVCYHQLLIACKAKGSKSLSFFQIKNRPRDLDIVVPHGSFDLNELIGDYEVCSLSMHSTADSILVAIGIDNGALFLLELNLDLSIKSQKQHQLSAPVSSFKYYHNEANVGFVFACRDGTWFAEALVCNQLGNGPLSIMSFLNDSLIIYSDSGAVVYSIETGDSTVKPREIFDWKMTAACEFQFRPEEPWIVGIDNDCLVMMALNRSKTSSLSKKVIFNNSRILCFNQDDTSGNWIIGHREEDGKNYLSFLSTSGGLLFSFDEGIHEPVQILKHSRANTIIVIIHSKDESCSNVQIFTLHKDKFEIVNEFICSGLIKKAVFDNNTIMCCINDELIGIEICPNFLNFPRRSSFHFRNKILDFDFTDGWVVVSTLSDGLDVLCLVSDAESFGFKHRKGDALSRSCLACLWKVPGQEIVYCDKKGFFGYIKAVAESKFLIDGQHWQLNEIGTSLFRHGNNFFVQTISGGIVKIEE